MGGSEMDPPTLPPAYWDLWPTDTGRPNGPQERLLCSPGAPPNRHRGTGGGLRDSAIGEGEEMPRDPFGWPGRGDHRRSKFWCCFRRLVLDQRGETRKTAPKDDGPAINERDATG